MRKSCSPSRMKSWVRWLCGRFIYAFAGIRDGVLKDRSICTQLIFGGMALTAAVLLRCSAQEWLWILLAVTLVIVMEIMNSCIEKCVDYISLEYTQQAKLIKDMAAAAVLIASLFALAVALIVLLPKFLAWFL